MFWFIAFLVFLGALFYGVKAYIEGNDDFWPKQGVPLSESHVLGTFWERITFKFAFHELDDKMYKRLKSFGKIKFGGIMEFRRPVAFLLDLDLIKTVMVKDFDHFTNRRQFGGKNDPTLFHKMLFAMDNPEWKDLRATLSPTFTTGKIRKMFSVFTESSKKMAAFLNAEIRNSPEIEMRDVSGRYTMDVIASSAFGVDSENFSSKNSTFAAMGHKFQNQFSNWFGTMKLFMSFLAPGIYNLLRLSFLDQDAFNFFKSVALKTIEHRDRTGEKRNDFLQLLMEARSGEVAGDDADTLDTADKDSTATDGVPQKAVKIKLDEELIVAQCLLFFLAGFDTTETLLIYAMYEMALNPEMQEKLAQELKDAAEKNGELDYDVVNSLEYLDMVVSETLRKYPPATRTERKCTKDYKVPDSKFEFKKGQVVSVPIWSIHHDPEHYPDPEKFSPERFTKENKNQRNPYTYMPFGVGPRNCIANRFAITEGKAAVAHLIHKFVVEPTAKTTIPMKYTANGALKPVGGMWLKVTPRN